LAGVGRAEARQGKPGGPCCQVRQGGVLQIEDLPALGGMRKLEDIRIARRGLEVDVLVMLAGQRLDHRRSHAIHPLGDATGLFGREGRCYMLDVYHALALRVALLNPTASLLTICPESISRGADHPSGTIMPPAAPTGACRSHM